MRTVDLILRKRGGDELSVEEIQYLINGYTTGEIPDYQMAAFLMATYFSGMTDRELSSFTEVMMASGEVAEPGRYSGRQGRQAFDGRRGRQDQPDLRSDRGGRGRRRADDFRAAAWDTPAARSTSSNRFRVSAPISRSISSARSWRSWASPSSGNRKRSRRPTNGSMRCAT